MKYIGETIQLKPSLEEGALYGGLEYKSDFVEVDKIYTIIARMAIPQVSQYWYRVSDMWYAISDEMIL